MTGIVVDDGAVVATAATVMVVVMTAEEAMAVVVGSDGECAGGEGGGSMASGGWRQRGGSARRHRGGMPICRKLVFSWETHDETAGHCPGTPVQTYDETRGTLSRAPELAQNVVWPAWDASRDAVPCPKDSIERLGRFEACDEIT